MIEQLQLPSIDQLYICKLIFGKKLAAYGIQAAEQVRDCAFVIKITAVFTVQCQPAFFKVKADGKRRLGGIELRGVAS